MIIECVTHHGEVTFERLDRDNAAESLLEIHGAMSPSARYMRYLSATPRITASMLRALSDVDGVRHVAWRATCGDRVVGLVRLLRDQDGILELAVELTDDHIGQGIGRALVSIAMDHAAALGATAIRVLVHPENTRAIRLFKTAGARFSLVAGTLEGTIPVTPSRSVAA